MTAAPLRITLREQSRPQPRSAQTATSFGLLSDRPTWRSTVAVAAELGDYQRAAHLGQQVDASPMPMERQVRHRLEVARALHFQRQQPDALALVLEAETRAPEQVRRHYMTHTLLHEWVAAAVECR